MRRIWEPCSFVGEKGVCTVCFPTLYIFVYPHLQIAVSVDAKGLKGLLRAFGEVSHRGAGKIGGSRVVL